MRQHSYSKDSGLTMRMGLMMVLIALVWVFFMGLLFWAGVPWFLVLGFALIGVLFQYFGSDRLVLMTTGARVVTAQEEPELHGMVERLAAMADMPKPKKIAVMDTPVPNAFATGRNPKNSVVAVTRGLMSRLSRPELEAVLGHELSHIKHRDVMVMTWAGLIVIMAGYLLQMLFWMSLFSGFGGGRDLEGDGNAFLIMMAVYLGTILVYFLSQLLILALSRYREFAADRGGSMLTGAPMQLASALAKISNDMYRIPEKDLRQVEHANAFFIVNALKGNKAAALLASHPPVEQRIERLRRMQMEMERPRQFKGR